MKRIRRLLTHRQAIGTPVAPVACAALTIVITTLGLTAQPTPPARPAIATVVEVPAPSRVAASVVAISGQQVPAPAPTRQNPNPLQAEPSALKRWLDDDVHYIITDEERAAFGNLRTDEERQQFIEQFWLRRNPAPGSNENEFRNEYYQRIAYANQHFSTVSGSPGWKTDRGKVYVMWGPPDEIQALYMGVLLVEIWRYRYIEGVGRDILITFSDPSGSGEFPRVVDPRER